MNRVILLGRLGQDPEIKQTPNGNSVVTLNLATTERWMKDGKRQERAQWHRIVVWGKLAELTAQYTQKGQQLVVEGRLESREWSDKQGVKHYVTEVIASSIEFIGAKHDRLDSEPRLDRENATYTEPQAWGQAPASEADDIPF